MAKFNKSTVHSAPGNGPIAAEATPSTVTYEGGPGYLRDAKSELFLLAVANMVGEDTFYERAADRDDRFTQLVRQVAVDDVDWLGGFLPWLRNDANMRSAPLVAVAEAVHARLAAGLHGNNRALVHNVLARADEPGEFLAYWTSRFGRVVPKPVKRGIADAVRWLYTQRSMLKYDTASHGFRFADVINIVHPSPAPNLPLQGELFRHAMDRRYGRSTGAPASLHVLRNNELMRRMASDTPDVLLDAGALRAAGMTWEDALSLGGDRVNKAQLWEALIPSMGLMALARNLRNFDEAGVSDAAIQQVIARFIDPMQVARSRMFPFRWLSAYEAAPSLRWGHALDQALQASLANIPSPDGRTLILVDTSGSMTSTGLSKRSTVTPLKAAAVFGVALAAKGEQVDLIGFADGVRPFRHTVAEGASVIREVDRFCKRSGEDGHGTNIAGALARTYDRHDRVVIVSDMQTMDGPVTTAVSREVPLYGFNLGGYRAAAFDAGSPNRVEFGGLTDATFRMLPLIEAGRNAAWPWMLHA